VTFIKSLKDILENLQVPPNAIPIPKKINDNSPKGGTRLMREENKLKS